MKSSFSRVLICCLALLLALPLNVSATAFIKGSPKILNLYLGWEMRESDLPQLARWDVLVLDVDQQYRYPEYLRKLRQLNPQIRLLAYVSASEIAQARFEEPQEFPMGKMAAQIQDEWYLRAPDGNRTEFWPGSALLNVTDASAPAANGLRWGDFLPDFLHDEVLSTGLWDGVFLDSTYVGISWFAKGPVDLNRDGVAETAEEANRIWQTGMRQMLERIRAKNPNAVFVGNGGVSYADILNGVLLENFPSWDWTSNLWEYRNSVALNREPKLSGLNVNTKNEMKPSDYRNMRFGLGTALLDDGYYSFDQGDAGHHVLWWYDEYSAPLGKARKKAEMMSGSSGSSTIWTREYERGVVYVNPTAEMQVVVLPQLFEKLHGTQDRKTNDGSLVKQVQIEPNDSLVLLRRPSVEDVKEVSFINGSFARLVNTQGQAVQNGLFLQKSGYANGAQLLSADLDLDGKQDLVTASQGSITIRNAKGGKKSFKPFSSIKASALSIAVGNVQGDIGLEIIVGVERTGSSEVRVYTNQGKLLEQWYAYGPNFRGGVSVAAGDIDGDGQQEIVTAPGSGMSSRIKIWKTGGRAEGKAFTAFDSGDVSGISLAVGDTDGDGREEIIAGSGPGAMPRVRLFDGQGVIKSEFTKGSKPSQKGIRLTAADINADGLSEIVLFGLADE